MTTTNHRIRHAEPGSAKQIAFEEGHELRHELYEMHLADKYGQQLRLDPSCILVREKSSELDESQAFRRMPLAEMEQLWEEWSNQHLLACSFCRKHAIAKAGQDCVLGVME